jgi:Cd2+/Zn2+-exporting ATPase
MKSREVDLRAVQGDVDKMESGGATVVALAEERRLLAIFALRDAPRAGVRQVVEEIKSLGFRHLAMLTGDNERVAQSVARTAGLTDVQAGLLPDEKLEIVRQFRERVGDVGMIGDGINDAPALATATVGFAMAAAGSDTAIETADVALMGNDLSRLPDLIRLSRRAAAVIRQNIAFSLLTKLGLIAAAVTLGVPLWVAVGGVVGVSLIVTLYALRLGA